MMLSVSSLVSILVRISFKSDSIIKDIFPLSPVSKERYCRLVWREDIG
jgi:hypothetical protein